MSADNIKRLDELFALRVKAYQDYTDQIKTLIGDGLKAIEEYIINDIMQPSAQVSWGVVTHRPELNALFLTANVSWPIGTKINTADGSHMEITEANSRYFNFSLQMGMPIALMFEGRQEILAFLRTKEDEEHKKMKNTRRRRVR
jgi:hypothetical protein